MIRIPGECTVCGGQNGNHASWCGHGRKWRTSSYSFSNGNCVEAAEDWRKSGFSKSGNCVEVASGVAVRDTQDREGPVLKFSAGAWRAFTTALDTGKHVPYASERIP